MRAPRTTLALLLVVLGTALLAGCGGGSRKDEQQPVACREGVATLLEALRGAPGEVILAGETPISGCLVAGAEEGELADFGEVALAAATKLNAEGRAEPSSYASVQLGYLLGAIYHGNTMAGGAYTELLNRLKVAAFFSPKGKPLPQRFEGGYAFGFNAARGRG